MKKNRVYGVIGIVGNMSNWNADFTGRPKTTSKGKIYGSDKALKYPMKVKWMNEGEKVLYIKSLKDEKKKDDKNSISPKSLAERYEELFNESASKKTSTNALVCNLFKCIDVMNFGATFAEANANISITGAVQIGQGFNQYDDTRVEIQDILSPFRNSKKEDANNSSLGTKIVADEAHYCYPFTVNPDNYNNYAQIIDGFEGYTQDAYEKFKEAALVSATAFATNSKFGCDNEYSIFVEMKGESKRALPNLSNYMKFEKKDAVNQLNLSKLSKLIQTMDEIDCVEIYFDPLSIEIKDLDPSSKVKCYHILTREEVM
ncbi:type I CRISPR-associated protein Cas7 [Fusibacter sp. 3D3]|uniref:type I CRISPR-associated protein Cas7 n=1 Tax=Fusibacter sp. 3D3 TaxID=1048380 RepID=UPI000853B8F7|nr:type I CRISPR-associated protein Cas7 [Fusibacter sp. 3D3]GAU77700.1 CRISPR-associated protein, Csh2 family [Fusibacter sp. 3D3]